MSAHRPTGKWITRTARLVLGVVLLALGALGLLLGGTLIASAHPIRPVEVEGYIVAYSEITVDGAYARNELRLAHDGHTYTLDRTQFRPSLPRRLLKDGRTRIWVDAGTTHVVAITLYNELGLNPTSYVTTAYTDPELPVRQGQVQGGLTLAAGVIVVLAALIWLARPGDGARRRAVGGPDRSAQLPGLPDAPRPATLGSAGPPGWPTVDEPSTLRLRIPSAPTGGPADPTGPPTASDPAEQPTLTELAVPSAGGHPEEVSAAGEREDRTSPDGDAVSGA